MPDAPEWFEDDLDERTGARRRLVVAAVAAVAVIAVAAVVLGRDPTTDPQPASDAAAADVATADATTGDDGGTVGGAPHDAAADPLPSTDADPPHLDGDGPAGPHGPGSDPDTAGTDPADLEDAVPALGSETVTREELEAVSLVVLRAWLSDGGPDVAVPGVEVDRRAYLEHAAVETVEVAGGLAVARVVLVLLVRDGELYTEAVVRRAAVPFTVTTTSLRPAGTPWWLPDPDPLAAAPPETAPSDDPTLATRAAEALTVAGYLDVEVASVATTPWGTVVAEVTARTPADDPIDGPLWLHPTPAGLVVLGGDHHRPAPAADDATPEG